MKLLINATFILAGFCAFSQNVLLVDNTPTAPTGDHVYSTLQDAIDASTPGAIIHVKPSNTSYGSFALTAANDSISIFGIGINPDKEIKISSTVTYGYVSGYNIRISGLNFTATLYLGYNAAAGNINVDNCILSAVEVGYNYATSNVVIRNSIMYGFLDVNTNANSTVISNCIHSYTSTTTSGAISLRNGTLFSHCLVVGDGTASKSAFYEISHSTISNCIFYGRSPQFTSSNTNNTFNNNYTEGSLDPTFPTGNGNSVNGTIASITGPLFTDTNIVPTLNWNVNWDPALDATGALALIAGGDDGTNIGVTGGTIPFLVTGTPLPYIKSFIVPSVIKQGDDLDVTIKALGN